MSQLPKTMVRPRSLYETMIHSGVHAAGCINASHMHARSHTHRRVHTHTYYLYLHTTVLLYNKHTQPLRQWVSLRPPLSTWPRKCTYYCSTCVHITCARVSLHQTHSMHAHTSTKEMDFHASPSNHKHVRSCARTHRDTRGSEPQCGSYI